MTDADEEESIQKRIDKLPRDCICCDYVECGKAAPPQRCSRCRVVYYCSRECQRKDWGQHRADCDLGQRVIEQSGLDMEQAVVVADITATATDTYALANAEDRSCPICLTTEIERPITLKKCRHQFCYSCLRAWQQRDCGNSCPMCRSQTEDVEEGAMASARILAQRATTLEKRNMASEQEIRDIRLNGIQQVDNVLIDSPHPHLQAMGTKAEILIRLKDFTAALEVCDRIIEIDNERHAKMDRAIELLARIDEADALGLMDEQACLELDGIQAELQSKGFGKRMAGSRTSRHTEIHLMKAEGYEGLERWEDAKEVYVCLLQLPDFYEKTSPPGQRAVFMGFARCAYHIGLYDNSIAASQAALEMNKHFPNVHKYLALAQKAQGDLQTAVDTMNRAALYETPWDDDHREEVLQLYEQLKSDLEEGEA